ncbi:MAG TPA: DUF3857 domain-containing transglutaminase family protein, partial [Gemmatimonadales bacterium]|nr:DUF3857 domain-containing transglutaminase family protein [Gemmatimonadales bacterium]
PSVRSDTIYALAVDSTRYPDEPYVVLLDDGVVRYEADGRGTRTYRSVIQILQADAVDTWAEQQFGYSPGHEKLTVNWVRVVRPDGSVVSDAPGQVQDADVPATLGDPVYSDRKVRRYSLRGVAPGTIVDFSYTIEELKPFLPGDFYRTWSIHNAHLVRRSRYIVDLPAGFTPHLIERNLNFARQTREVHGRRVWTWVTQDVPKPPQEDFASDSNGVLMSIELGGALSWQEIGKWYAGLARGRYALTPDVKARLPGLLADARSATDTLRALQRFVAQDIRYVSISLGLGGYQPRTPEEVVSSGYGDCKDKATLFVALAGAVGFRAWPVLLNSGGDVTRAIPSLQQFDHAIAAVELAGGRTYVDLTSDLTPFGQLPPSDQGEFALVVHPDGATEEVTLPLSPPGDNLSETIINGTLSPEGMITASYVERSLGSRQYQLRNLFTSSIDSAQRAAMARSLATRLYPGASADSLQIFDGRDLTADTRVALRIMNGQAARPAGASRKTMILTLPVGSMRSMADAATALEAKGPRVYPIDAAKVIGPIAGLTELTLTLPAGWHTQLPPPVDVRGKWGTYSSHYTQEGQTLKVTRRLEGARGVYPPDDLYDLTAWLRAVARDDVPYLVIETAGTP